MKTINTTQIIERDEAFRYFERLMRRGTIRLKTPASAEQTAQPTKQTAYPTNMTAQPTNQTAPTTNQTVCPMNMTAREQVVYEHYTLVISIAAEYQHQGLEIMDLIMAGMTGLMMAYDKYDAERGIAFSTLASYRIHGEICDALTTCGHPIRLPKHQQGNIRRITAAQDSFYAQHGREPTADELSEIVQIDAETIVKLQAAARRLEEYEEENEEKCSFF